jgi:hypothetical protein
MRIDAPEGTKVRFAHPDWGWDKDGPYAMRYLEVGGVYTVDHTVIHKWETDVYFKEIPERAFNSVLFEEVDD